MPAPETFDAAVVGGGVAGMSAATALAERGARVLLIEARHELGGRTSSFTDAATGETADNGQHILLGCYDEALALVRRTGALSNLARQDSLSMDVVDREGRLSRLRCSRLPSPAHLLDGLIRWDAIGWPDRLSALRLAVRPKPHPAETVALWLRRLGQSPRLVELLWEPLALAALNQPIDVASAAPFAEVLERMLRTRGDASIVVPAVPLRELFAVPARVFIEQRGGTVRVDSPARLVPREDGAIDLTVRGTSVEARAVIAAVEWHGLAALFPTRPDALRPVFDAAASTPPAAILSAHLWLDRPVMTVPFLGLPRRPWQWIFDASRQWHGRSRHLSLVASAADELAGRDKDALVAMALETVRNVLPVARDAALTEAVVVRERRATFSVAPGMAPRPRHETPWPGVFLAGDWIGNTLPATIEAAAASGHAAARLAARYLDL
jgi:squalene-associated FAD-dependent desaturase